MLAETLAILALYIRFGHFGFGIGVGCIVAIVCCYQRNKNLLLALVLGILLGWIYVIYWAFTFERNKDN